MQRLDGDLVTGLRDTDKDQSGLVTCGGVDRTSGFDLQPLSTTPDVELVSVGVYCELTNARTSSWEPSTNDTAAVVCQFDRSNTAVF